MRQDDDPALFLCLSRACCGLLRGYLASLSMALDARAFLDDNSARSTISNARSGWKAWHCVIPSRGIRGRSSQVFSKLIWITMR
jgi:hypothetical protein